MAQRTDGKPCAAPAIDGSEFCKYHAPRLGRLDWDTTAPVTNEAAITAAFCRWLEHEDQGWTVDTEVDGADVVARRCDLTMVCEVKGITSAPSVDTDILYGQLLRRMDPLGEDRVYAVVVPADFRRVALRVPIRVRDRLGIKVFTVDRDGRVTEVNGDAT